MQIAKKVDIDQAPIVGNVLSQKKYAVMINAESFEQIGTIIQNLKNDKYYIIDSNISDYTSLFVIKVNNEIVFEIKPKEKTNDGDNQ